MTHLPASLLKSKFSKHSTALNERAAGMVKKIDPFLVNKRTVLDIGAGTGHISKLLSSDYKVTPLDVRDTSAFQSVEPVIYDGETFPFEDKQFDVSLIITVLHHTRCPEQVLAEANRVSRELIVVEDVYDGTLQKYCTYIMDSVVNFEFFNHPHSNKSSVEWASVFREMNVEVLYFEEFRFWRFFQGALFHLQGEQ